MNWTWDWILGATAGGVLGVIGTFLYHLFKGPARPRMEPSVYLEPKRAKEVLRDLERRKEQTLTEIDRKYAAARRDFGDYLEAQRERIIADLKKSKDKP